MPCYFNFRNHTQNNLNFNHFTASSCFTHFSGFRFFCQVFLGPGFSGFRFLWVRVQVLGPIVRSNRTPPLAASKRWKIVKLITLQINLFTKVTGNRVSNYCARNVCKKVFLKIAVPWLLMPSKILHQSINKYVGKYLQ